MKFNKINILGLILFLSCAAKDIKKTLNEPIVSRIKKENGENKFIYIAYCNPGKLNFIQINQYDDVIDLIDLESEHAITITAKNKRVIFDCTL